MVISMDAPYPQTSLIGFFLLPGPDPACQSVHERRNGSRVGIAAEAPMTTALLQALPGDPPLLIQERLEIPVPSPGPGHELDFGVGVARVETVATVGHLPCED